MRESDEVHAIASSFICPITQEVMEDPVMDNEGNSYERYAIMDWLKRQRISPVTRAPLSVSDLRPNRGLRDAIEAWRKKNGEKVEKQDRGKGMIETPDVDEVKLSFSVRKDSETEATVHLSAEIPDRADRPPCDIVCVVDTSGSMGTEAKMRNDTGGTESHGLSLLDVVKHAMKTVIHTLKPEDRLALVEFNTQAKQVFKFIKMDDNGKKSANTALTRLTPDGQTNLWGGLTQALEMFESSSAGKNMSIMLLTDGMPNIAPPRGTVAMLKRFIAKKGRIASINTFGFGYTLDSAELHDISSEGTGLYSFIPDSSFVGTVFVNALGSILATVGKNACLEVKALEGVKVVEVLGGHLCSKTSSGEMIHIGNLPAGESKDFVVKLAIEEGAQSPYITASLKYENTDPAKQCEVEGEFFEGGPELEVQRLRLCFVDCVSKALNYMAIRQQGEANQVIDELIEAVKSSSVISDERLSALLEDLQGQVKEALSKTEYFEKWGVHYLPSLARAHLLQVCNNFKDPGVQLYGGKLFAEIRDEADELFCELPPPKPSISPPQLPQQPPQRQIPLPSMRQYNNSYAPCFDGRCLVAMHDGSSKKVEDIRKGDVVLSENGAASQVVCVVKTICEDGKRELVCLEGGLVVTPWHPIYDKEEGEEREW
eukprot:CAMPEP_0174256730 /NCGR_PEP_ID=MMETSP0439-20130205/5932_1 /TAXON_ID=0 /ORGANISM="Stereomyxa ramosa, Strain Chinc5" /LENGTH=654 /DNA_ID=CAMNT_0015339467 /DNA_START=216 /DNA_END=2177 /DNA_ORIENTATION=+